MYSNDDIPLTLSSQDLKGVARFIESEPCQNIFIMAGAGISTSAGIPDFRSPETGLYANLQKLNLPRAEAVFDIDYFRTNPVPFYILAKDMNPEQFRPTPTHSFFRLLEEKGLLGMCFTQNIDTLERKAGVPAHRLVEAHGSFASNKCIQCLADYPMEKMKKNMETGEIPYCEVPRCGNLVKPTIVFFGESLPRSFFNNYRKFREADLLLILGTSLTVHPFASLADMVPLECPRVLINIDQVGDIGDRPNDVLLLGKCDDIIWKLCEELGWKNDLEQLWEETRPAEKEEEKAKPPTSKSAAPGGPSSAGDADIQKKIDEITSDIRQGLKISDVERNTKTEASEESHRPADEVSGVVQVPGQVEDDAVEVKGTPDAEKAKETSAHEVNDMAEVTAAPATGKTAANPAQPPDAGIASSSGEEGKKSSL